MIKINMTDTLEKMHIMHYYIKTIITSVKCTTLPKQWGIKRSYH